MRKAAALVLIGFLISQSAYGQMERRKTVTDEPVEVFLTMSLITMSTSSNLHKNNMNSTIMHNFGLVSTGIEEFWG
ncbi:MAG: DUF5777 family beta-barrel protein, partial [Balneola sp.]